MSKKKVHITDKIISAYELPIKMYVDIILNQPTIKIPKKIDKDRNE